MPIEDIDEDDDYVTPTPPPPFTSSTSKSNGGVFDPFGDGSGGGSSQQHNNVTKHVKQASINEFDDFFSSPGSAASKPAHWGTSSHQAPINGNRGGNQKQQSSTIQQQQNNDFIDFSKGSKTVQSHRNTEFGAADLVNKLNLAAKGIHIRSQPTLSEMATANTTSNTDILTNPALLRRMSHYEVLGIVNPAYADDEDISRHYKKKALALHPDKFLTREGRPQTENEEALFKAIVRAYEVLLDAPRRKQYDEDLAYARRAGIPIEDINSDTANFGGGPPSSSPPQQFSTDSSASSPHHDNAAHGTTQSTPATKATFDNGNLWDTKKPSAAKASDLDDLFAPSSSNHHNAATPQSYSAPRQPAWGGGSTTVASKGPTANSGGGYGGKQSTNIDDLFS